MGDNIPEQGVYSLREALRMAEEQELDLVEISAKADPPVCRIMDYQKYLYQQKKKAKEMNEGTVSVRRQGGVDAGSMPVDDFVALVSNEIKDQLS